MFVPDLPGNNERAATLDFREFLRHVDCIRSINVSRLTTVSERRIINDCGDTIG